MAARHLEDTLQHLRSQFADTPGLSLTPADVARHCAVDPPTAAVLLRALADSRFLERMPDGRFALAHHADRDVDGHTCALCGQTRVRGSLLQVAEADDSEALWDCTDCQHQLTLGVDDDGVQGG